jgi:hypothetical protein
MWVEARINWVEAFFRVLRAYHDTPGEFGFSPFQEVFGRDRFVSGIPFQVQRECLGATQFFERMEWLDGEVARRLRDQIEKEVERSNRVRRPPPLYRPVKGLGVGVET